MAKINRGDVVIAKVPQGTSFKVRPVVVIQNDQNNARLTNVFVAMVITNTRLASKQPTQVLIDIGTADGQQTGLLHNSAVKCENIFTLPSNTIRKIGVLPDALVQQLDDALRVSLAL